MGATEDEARRLGIACDADTEGRAGFAGTAVQFAASQSHSRFCGRDR
jgi:hypothetical protein